MIRDALYLTLVVAVAILTWQVRGYTSDESTPKTTPDTVKVDRQSPTPSWGATPDLTEVFEPVRDTVEKLKRDTVYVPRSIGSDLSLIGSDALEIDGHTVRLNRYDTDAGRYIRDTYHIPEKRNRIAPYIAGDVSESFQRVAAGAVLDWKRLTIRGGYQVTNLGHGPTVGVTVRPVSYRW